MMSALRGDLMLLGAGGKMGPALCRMAVRADEAAGVNRTITAVSRFGDAGAWKEIESSGARILCRDMLEPGAVEALPDAENVIFMAGRKFATTGDESLTWAVNCLLPGEVIRRYRNSRIVVLSTGNVYPFTSPASGGPDEESATGPVGEYAWSSLARERIAFHLSDRQGTPVSILRLNYAIDPRYGVLTDIALKVFRREPVHLRNGYVNVIWQADACAAVLLALERCSSPPFVLNVTGPEILSVRKTAMEFGRKFETPVEFIGSEAEDALLSHSGLFHSLWDFPKLGVGAMMDLVAHWLLIGGELYNKPTRFEDREGKF